MIKKIFNNLLIAQVLSTAAVTICMLVDSIMIGQFLGVDAIAAYGLASPVLFIFAAVGALLSTGIQVIASRTMATGDSEGTNRCFTASIVIALLVSIVGLILIYSFTDQLVSLLGATYGTPVFAMTKQYLRGFVFGAPAFILSTILVPYFQLSDRGTRLVVAVILMSVTDISLDYINVAVVNGGILGMGVASALSYYVALIVAATYLFSKQCVYKFVPTQINLRDCLRILKHSIPTAVNQICFTLQVFSLNQILLSLSSNDGVAIYSVLSTVGTLCFSVGTGLGAVALTLSSVMYIEEDRHALHEIVRIISRYSIIINAAVIVIFELAAPWVISLFLEEDPVVTREGIRAMRMFILCLIPSSLNSSYKSFYQGVKRVWLCNIIAFLQNFAYVCLFALIFSQIGSGDYVWMAFFCGETLTFITTLCIVFVNQNKVSFNARNLAFLNPNFGARDNDVMLIPIKNKDEVIDASIKASEFCLNHSGDKHIALRVSLCIEEMGKNTITHGFNDGKEHDMLVRVVFKNNKWVISLRDDCSIFDPIKYRKAHKDAKKTTNVGLNLVFAMASEIKYVETLGLNNLTIVIG